MTHNRLINVGNFYKLFSSEEYFWRYPANALCNSFIAKKLRAI